MNVFSFTAISPLDGRYSDNLSLLRDVFSEYSLFKFRLQVEIRWLQKLSSCSQIQEIPYFESQINNYLNSLIDNFNIQDMEKIKNIENIINHDVKAVEYFLKEKISNEPTLCKVTEFIHFACTSEDINNLAYAIMMNIAKNDIILPIWYTIINRIKKMSMDYKDIPLLSRTHGQPASPSTVGKELANFAYRLYHQYKRFKKVKILGKMNGAVGNYNAHYIAYPDVNWHKISEEFVTSFDNIFWNPYTTQIEPHDYLVELFNCIVLFNTILINFARDIWGYIAFDYFIPSVSFQEIGSSTMPHKVNPIDFENAEGNLGLSNSIMTYFSAKLPISRWQRDLSDSTVLRNIGVGISYSFLAYHSLLKGINRLQINKSKLISALDDCWVVLSEALQTVMRRYGIPKSYEIVKELFNMKNINHQIIESFIDSLHLPLEEKYKLKMLTPHNYIGYAINMVEDLNK